MKYLQILLCFTIVLVAPLTMFVPAQAADPYTVTFSYSCTNDNADDVNGSIGQFSVLVTDEGSNQVGFTFYNTGSYDSNIAEIYFDDGTLLGIATITDSGDGVDFVNDPVSPPDLPGGNNCIPKFEVTQGFLAGATPSPAKNGVANVPEGEWVKIVFELKTGGFADVVNQLNTGELRIGIHVTGLGDDEDGSESFVSGPGTAVQLDSDSFSASASRGKVSLSWITGTEIDNAGFNLYRASSLEGLRVLVNSGLISSAAGSVSGASYSVADAPGYGTYYYWLEDVSTGGAATLHGPVSVSLSPAFRLPTYRPVLPGGF